MKIKDRRWFHKRSDKYESKDYKRKKKISRRKKLFLGKNEALKTNHQRIDKRQETIIEDVIEGSEKHNECYQKGKKIERLLPIKRKPEENNSAI